MNPQTALRALAALSQETRLTIYSLLARKPDGIHAHAIATQVEITPAALSFHLKALIHAGLVIGTSEGRFVRYRARTDATEKVLGYLAKRCGVAPVSRSRLPKKSKNPDALRASCSRFESDPRAVNISFGDAGHAIVASLPTCWHRHLIPAPGRRAVNPG